MKLRIKFLLSISALILVVVGVIVLIVNHLEEKAIIEDRRVKALDLVYVLAHSSVQAIVADDYVVLQEILDSVHSKRDIIQAMILDNNGRVLVHNNTRMVGQIVMDPLSTEALRSNIERSIRIKYEGTEPAWDVSVPVLVSNEKMGTARIIFSLESAYREIARTRNTVLIIGVFAFLGGVLLSTFLARVITRPMYKLVDATRKIGKGDLSYRVRIGSGDEIGELARSFNRMADGLVERGKELEEKIEQLSELSSYNENILQSMSSGVITVDLQGRIITFNRSAEKITGLKGQDARRRNPREILSGDQTLGDIILGTLKENRGERTSEEKFKNARGEELTLQVSTRLLRNMDGDVIGVLAVFNDLTEIKKLEEEMNRAERLAALGTTAASIAHEIKTPLTSLSTLTQLFPTRYNDPQFRKRFQAIVLPQVDRLTNLVNDLLDFSRPETPLFQKVQINSLVKEAADILMGRAVECGITISFDLNPHLPKISVDPDHISQVFLNIIQNALQAMPDGGTLKIATACDAHASRPLKGDAKSRMDGGFIEISFSDTGVGIARENLDKLFEPFFSTKSKGTGLGLAISFRIVRDHRGSIQVQSEVGKGTTFVVRLPKDAEGKEVPIEISGDG